MRWKASRLHRSGRVQVSDTSSAALAKISEQSEEIFLADFPSRGSLWSPLPLRVLVPCGDRPRPVFAVATVGDGRMPQACITRDGSRERFCVPLARRTPRTQSVRLFFKKYRDSSCWVEIWTQHQRDLKVFGRLSTRKSEVWRRRCPGLPWSASQ